MVRRHITMLRLALMAADGVTAAGVFVAVSMVRFGVDGWIEAWQAAGADGRVLAVAYGLGWVGVLLLLGLYRLRARWSARREVLDLGRAVLLLAVATFVLLFWLKLPNVSRQFLLLLFPAQFAVAVASRALLRWAFGRARERGMNARYMLVIGAGPAAAAFANRVEAHSELGLQVIGHMLAPGEAGTVAAADASSTGRRIGRRRQTAARPILGSVDDVEAVFHSRVVDEVAICLPPEHLALTEAITHLCEEEGKIVRIPTKDLSLTLPGSRAEEFDGIRVLSLVYGPDRIIGLLSKRAIDVAAAIGALIVLSPVLAVIALLIRLVDGGPILFHQGRVGLHGRPFAVVKFRTMVPDAEGRLADLQDLNEIRGHAFKMTDDPRISRSGRLLRRWSLDELPQLWNVLRGDMSIVGPRPPLPSEVEGYDIWHRRRLSMKPGITGLWQVAARREADFDRWVALDLEYIDRWSLWLDLKIMARTIPAVLAQQGR